MVRRLAVVLLVALAGISHAPLAIARQIDPPRKVKDVEPLYPETAQRARIQGEVVIQATVGTDGKVSAAKVVRSIPLLDESALAAVRQWEYAPATLNGVAVSVTMTVKVKFALGEPVATPRAEPLVLDRSGPDWTVAGTPLLDGDLRFWLHDIVRSSKEKELVFHAPGTSTYGEVIEVLSSAIEAGFQDLRVFAGDATAGDAVRVWLEPLAQKAPGVSLPVAAMGSPVRSTGLPIVVPRTGTTAAARASLQRVRSAAVVRLRIDRSRRMADVWPLLQLAAAHSLEGFALAVQLPPGASVAANAPVSPQQQQEWERVSEALSKIVLSGKPLDDAIAESTPMLETFVARNPNVLDAQFKLASAYEGRTLRAGVAPESRRRDLEAAIRHLTLPAEFHDDADVRFLCTWKIAQLYGADGLADAVHAQRYARRMSEEFPAHAESHMFYATLLHDAGDVGGATNVLRHGRTVVTMPLTGLVLSLQYLVEQVNADRRLPAAEARKLLEEAIAVADAIVANPDKTDTDYQLAAMGKAIALELEAERVARTSPERVALLAESERWGPPMERHKNGAPPPPVTLSAAEAREIEWRAVGRWNVRLIDEGRFDEAIDAIGKYSTEHPEMYEPHAETADLLVRSAERAKDPAARTAILERAANELQRAIDLAPVGPEQLHAFERLLDVTGPKNLNRPDRQETAARTMLKRRPQEPSVHYALVSVLLRSGKSSDADKALRNARSAIKPTPATRAAMASKLLSTIREQNELSTDAARRLFDEAGALASEAEKLNGRAENADVIEARMGWLYLSAERFEHDPVRAAAQREEAKRLDERARAIRMREIK